MRSAEQRRMIWRRANFQPNLTVFCRESVDQCPRTSTSAELGAPHRKRCSGIRATNIGQDRWGEAPGANRRAAVPVRSGHPPKSFGINVFRHKPDDADKSPINTTRPSWTSLPGIRSRRRATKNSTREAVSRRVAAASFRCCFLNQLFMRRCLSSPPLVTGSPDQRDGATTGWDADQTATSPRSGCQSHDAPGLCRRSAIAAWTPWPAIFGSSVAVCYAGAA